MKKVCLYTIRHIDVQELLQQRFKTNEEKKAYWVFWWEQIPLGHRWVANPDHKKIGPESVWGTIAPILNYYCSQYEKNYFDPLKNYWRQGSYDDCMRLLKDLFNSRTKILSNDPGLSLIICTRNRAAYLKHCLDAISQLSTPPKEVIVVDNAPDDQSAKELVDACSFATYVVEPRKGLDRARNTGWQKARYPIVAYTDDDVRLHKDWVGQMIAAFSHPRIKAATGIVFAEELKTRAQILFEKYWSFNRGYRDIYYDTDFFRRHLKGGVPAWTIGAGASMAFRRSALEVMGGFDNRLDVGASGCSGDSEMWYRLMAAGWTIHYTPRAIAYHTHRQRMDALKRQIFYYLRGSSSSLLIQYQRHRHKGNLCYLFKTLPKYYADALIKKIRHPRAEQYTTLRQEIAGNLAGLLYFLQHRKYSPRNTLKQLEPVPCGEKWVSVIITSYNHAHYIKEAIESVRQQTYSLIEIIVVDDGSTDHTAQVVSEFPEIKYIYQHNRGLAAARNTGIFHSKGDYLVFLDADDLLYPYAIDKNCFHFKAHPLCAFVSGGHDKVDEKKKLITSSENIAPQKHHYSALLRGNYIGMHAAVMYRREIFNSFLFDETLPACEDYDLYLRITKQYPIFSHNEKLAAYRIHAHNMSKNIRFMLKQVKIVLQKEKDFHNPEVNKNYREGIKNWTAYYTLEIYNRITNRHLNAGYKYNAQDFGLVATHMPWPIFQFFIHKIASMLKRKNLSAPKPGSLRLGDLRRTNPLSKMFGYDRGGPVDRYYIESFLEENAAYIRGHVMEVGDNAYTMTYGKERVTKSEILHINESNPEATIIGDLSTAHHIPDHYLDCIVLTQTLHLIYDFRAAIGHCYRILKPGGSLLLTVPGITQIDYGEWGDSWYWSFTGRAIQRLLSEYFQPEELLVQTHGNVLSATGFLYGMGQQELTRSEKEENDPHYQVIITARAIKTASPEDN